MELSNRQSIVLFFSFIVVLALLGVFSTKVGFHDSGEYITVARALAGYNNIDLFVGHSIVYPAYISIFLNLFPSLLIIRLINISWIILIALLLLYYTKSKKSLLIFMFSPIVWYVGIQTTPVLPASFFFLLSYLLFNDEKLKYNELLSGLFLGISCAIYNPMILIAFYFTIIYFWNEKISSFVKFVIPLLVGFSLSLLLDFYYFGMPFYTMIRYIGANLLITIGLRTNHGIFQSFSNPETLLLLVFISPLLYKIYKIDYQKYKKEIILILLILLTFYLRESLIKYALIVAPLIIIFLSKIFNREDIKKHILISSIIIIFILFNFVSYEKDKNVETDLKNIILDYNSSTIVGEPYAAAYFAEFIWQNEPRFEWYEVYSAQMNNKSSFKEYNIHLDKSKLPLRDKLFLNVDFSIKPKNYSSVLYVSTKNESVEGFKLDKCYTNVCVYTKDDFNNSSSA